MTRTEIMARYGNHYIFDEMYFGSSKTMRGDVTVIFFYINDVDSRWTEAEIEKHQATCNEGLKFIQQIANADYVNLKLRIASKALDIPSNYKMENREQMVREALSRFSVSTASQYQDRYENKFDIDEAPIIFVVKEKFRSYAATASEHYPWVDEYSVVSCDCSPSTVAHELLHQFGARDYYYPQNIQKLATKYFPNSVMNVGVPTKIDSLTKFLIGWTDEIDSSAVSFLEASKFTTHEDVMKALQDEWKK